MEGIRISAYSSLFGKSALATLLGLEPFWLLILAPVVLLPGRFLPPSSQPYVILLLGLFWLLRWLTQRRVLPDTPLNWSIGFILLWLPVNFGVAIDKSQAWEAIGYLVLGIAIFVALVDWQPARQRPQLLAWIFLLISLGLVVLGPLLVTPDGAGIGPFVAIRKHYRFLSTPLGETINPNILAGALVLALPIQAALMLRPDWTKKRWIPIGIGILCAATIIILLLTLSRGADLAAAVAILVVLLLCWPRLLYSMPFLILGMVLYVDWVGPMQFLEGLTFNTKIGGLAQRIEIWSRAFYALQDFAFTGIGIGNFNVVIPRLYPYFSIPPTVDIPHAHHLFLQIGVDLGLPGLIAYLALLINVFVMLSSILRRRSNAIQWTLAAGILGSLIAMLVHGLVDATLWGVKLAFLPWLLFALVVLLFCSDQPS